MPEWSIGAVSKTVERFAFQGFESLSLRKITTSARIDAHFFLYNDVLRETAYRSERNGISLMEKRHIADGETACC